MDMNWVNEFWYKIEKKLSETSPNVETLFPYTTDESGKYVEYYENYGPCWWTNGFWAGIMWLAYTETKKELYKNIAIKCENKLDEAFLEFTKLHHDVGFMWLPSAVAHYRIDGDERAKARGLHAATLLAGRYNSLGRFIRAWNSDRIGWAIIDCMMNIPILYWASEIENDPRFKAVAISHADKAMKYFVRQDGSVNHIVVFDSETGRYIDNPCGQGYASGSSWSRGQAWALYGFVISYIRTDKKEYLDTAKKVAHYFISNLSADGVPDVDFRSPKHPLMKDTSAGAIAACGLIEIANLVDDNERNLYLNNAEILLRGLYNNCNFTDRTQAILLNGTERYHGATGHNIPIIYGDYFLIEALLKLRGNDLLFW